MAILRYFRVYGTCTGVYGYGIVYGTMYASSDEL